MPKSTAIIILGMHRSGTSCLAGSLQQQGISLGEVSRSNEYNTKGNRENQEIVSLNEDILTTSGGDWKKPPTMIRWEKAHEEKRDQIIKSLQQQNTPYWGFKDPRTLLTFKFWKQGLPSDFKIIGTFRHPLDVVNSLAKRPAPLHIPIQQGFSLWEYYNKIFLKLALEYRFPTISFNISKSEYMFQLNNIIKQLHITSKKSSMTFFDENLRHQKYTPIDHPIPENIMDLYEKLLFHSNEQKRLIRS